MTKDIQVLPNSLARKKFEHHDRRLNTFDRRTSRDRRAQEERRFDSRLATVKQRKTIRIWLRAVTRSRLGVDRRKKEDRRLNQDRRNRRQQSLRSLLTQEEITALLSP